MKYGKILIGVGILAGLVGWVMWRGKSELLLPGKIEKLVELPYARLSFARLAQREVKPGEIEIGRVIAQGEGYESHLFYYHSEGKKISGQINLPLTPMSNTMPVIVMARGYVDKEGYKTGMGTKNAAAYYASRGYITLAPDFLGYGESDPEDTDSIGARLYRPVEILDLLASLPSLSMADLDRVYLWGHSNGGQIMLSVGEVIGIGGTQKTSLPAGRTQSPSVPAGQCASGSEDHCVGESVFGGVKIRGLVLWAPVSKPFPFSILSFSDELEDQGKMLRKMIADFESKYDVFDYSIDRYFTEINLPIELHQGTADIEVPRSWSDELVKTLKEQGKDITYYLYPGADHNLKPGWDTVVARDIQFVERFK